MSYKENPYKYSLHYAYNAATEEFQRVNVDSGGGLVNISTAHYKTHRGQYFYVGHLNLALAGSGNFDILVNPGDKRAHVKLDAVLNTHGVIYIYEAPTITSNGTALTARNANRSSSNTPTLTAYHTPTVSSVGTLLIAQVITGGGFGANKIGSDISKEEDLFILAKNTDYLFRINNLSTTSAASMYLGFYEV